MTSPLKIAVLISGSGSNLQALIDEIAAGRLNAEIVEVISSRPDAYGLKRAQEAGIPTCSLNKEIYKDAELADEILASELKRSGAEYVVMAGYMRMVGRGVLGTFPNRVINIHPALLPSFPGAHAVQDALNAGVKVTGVTVHIANEIYDRGPIIAQRALDIEEGESLEALTERIHAIEHELYPEVIQLISEGRLELDPEGRVRILSA